MSCRAGAATPTSCRWSGRPRCCRSCSPTPVRCSPKPGPRPADEAVTTLVFDGDCGFCTTSSGLARRIAPDVDTVAWQLADLPALGLTAEDAAARVQLVADDGTVAGGA